MCLAYSKLFSCINSFNHQKNPVRCVLLLSLFYRWKHWVVERFSKSCKTIQLEVWETGSTCRLSTPLTAYCQWSVLGNLWIFLYLLIDRLTCLKEKIIYAKKSIVCTKKSAHTQQQVLPTSLCFDLIRKLNTNSTFLMLSLKFYIKATGSIEANQGFQMGSSSSEGEEETRQVSKFFTKPAIATGSSLETI